MSTDVSQRFVDHLASLDTDSPILANFAEDIISEDPQTGDAVVTSIEDVITAAEALVSDDDGISIGITSTLNTPTPGDYTNSALDPSNDPSALQFSDLLSNLDASLATEQSTYTAAEKDELLQILDNGAWERNAIDELADVTSTNSGLIEDILSGTAVNESGNVGIDGIIYKDTASGAVHIGENSLITNEVNGVQELYAEDGSGNAIDINITNNSDLLIQGASVATENYVDGLTSNNAAAIDQIEASSGFRPNGTYTANGSANYISTATTLVDADNLLDAQVKTNADDIIVNADDIDDNADAIDQIEASSGLNANGTYTANGSANYISTATTLVDADDLLDAQVKTNADDIIVNADDIDDNADAIDSN